ncbi:MAG: DUF1906 domain-containing protein [Renibacterium salmoninarum]|nr:DUF1906 domain-containing protein [Renibacterium salmoninarum]
MDPKVQEAQQWVNATYGQVTGYVRCPENGLTGWSTMYSLTMGLQHELGISPVVASFGPTTMAKLEELLKPSGEMGIGWNKNGNIVRILQHGLFCKGYWGANEYGNFDSWTSDSVQKLRANMGLPLGATSSIIFRCILNMDAYVVLAGGAANVREIQQWLNGRYWQKAAYSIGPCDGIYSRDVQKSLMIALQYEFGVEFPTGNFGPATQAALRSRTLRQGDSGILVELFSSACVFNEPVPLGGEIGDVRTSKRATFDAKLAEYVSAFQQFSQLPVTGQGDYATWAQLLVSMGDPDRPATGCDTRFSITPSRAQWLVNNGYRAIGRYIYDPPKSTLDKDIKPGELQTIFDAGMSVLPIYQDNGRLLSDFTYTQGYQHAMKAHERASGYGFNRGTVIYFAVDYDATQDDIDSAIIPYFQGVQAGLAYNGKKYVHGVYGSRNVCANVTKKTFARHSFVAGMSWGFSGNLGFPLPPNWSFNQIKEFNVVNGADNFDLDRNIWRAEGGDPGQTSINSNAGLADAFITYVQNLYDCARQYGKSDPSRLVMEYIRSTTYGTFEWNAVLGRVDKGFIDFANGKGFSIMTEFQDPFTGYTIGAEHLMATANGHLLFPQYTDPKKVSPGDITGWGGDLLTFYRDWRNASASYSSGYTFAMDKLAKPGVASSFSFEDLIEDADGYLLARQVATGTDIVTAVRQHYNGNGGLKRFTDYYRLRFINAETCNTLANDMLILAFDQYFSVPAAQLFLAGANPPPIAMPGDKLQEFKQGFTDTLLARTGMESSMATTYRENQQEYLYQAQTEPETGTQK